jgi:hypothetical protein
MTEEERLQVIRVCGKDHDESDIPAVIRKRDFQAEMAQIEAEEREAEDLEEEEKEEIE